MKIKGSIATAMRWAAAILLINLYFIADMANLWPQTVYSSRSYYERLDVYVGVDWLVYFLPLTVAYAVLAPFCVMRLTGRRTKLRKIRVSTRTFKRARKAMGFWATFSIVACVFLSCSPILSCAAVDFMIGGYSSAWALDYYYFLIPPLMSGLFVLMSSFWLVDTALCDSLPGMSPSFVYAGGLAAIFNIRNAICKINFSAESAFDSITASMPLALRNSLVIIVLGVACSVAFYRVNFSKQQAKPA